jgi:hypothetical protein
LFRAETARVGIAIGVEITEKSLLATELTVSPVTKTALMVSASTQATSRIV